LEGWLDGNDLARFIVDLVEVLDTGEIEDTYRGGGSAPYPPKMLLALLFYCYAKGIFSSRKIEQATRAAKEAARGRRITTKSA
jgi:transposase